MRALSVVLTECARSDLVDVWSWIAADDVDAAERYATRIRQALQALGDMPEMGRRRDEIAPGLRCFPVAAHVVFYRVTADAVQIVRVLSGRRDVDAQF